tara:strand:+ start:40 stop:597 length:558 start_codon:yes stop_codon:yes gene_type:complete
MGNIGPSVRLDAPAFIHESAHLYGRTYVGQGASIWINAVIRAEMHEVRIGARSNIQDFVMIHVGAGSGTIVGEDCSITHHATLHGCTIGHRSLIGINATIMDGAEIGPNSIVAGHSIVGEGKVFPENSVIAGVPAKLVATRDNSAPNLFNARFYGMIARAFAEGRDCLGEDEIAALASMGGGAVP